MELEIIFSSIQCTKFSNKLIGLNDLLIFFTSVLIMTFLTAKDFDNK